MRYFNQEMEKLGRDEIKQLQLERLQAVLNRTYKNVSFYQKMFDDRGISPDSIASLKDIDKIPFTRKENLKASYPYGMLAEPLSETVRIQFSSGTKGVPTVIGYTKNDIKHWKELVSRILVMAGVTKDDIVQISFDYGMFTGGFGYNYGAEEIGALVIPASSIDYERQLEIMRDFKTSVLIGLPSYALSVAKKMHELKLPHELLNLKTGIFGGETWREDMRLVIEDKLFLSAYDNYGLSELWGPGVSGECELKNGLHIWEDYFYPEIINPETGTVLKENEEGELVLTSLMQESMPVLRFRTGDITKLNYEPCGCGRTHVRMDRVKGRVDDMIHFRGMKFLPDDIGSIIRTEEEFLSTQFEINKRLKNGEEVLEISVSVKEEMFSDEIRKLEILKNRLREKIHREIGISPEIKLVEPPR